MGQCTRFPYLSHQRAVNTCYYCVVILLFYVAHNAFTNDTNKTNLRARNGILGYVWCLIVSIPDLYPLSYLDSNCIVDKISLEPTFHHNVVGF